MDRLRRRQIDARPFLRPAQFFVFHMGNSNSVWIGAGERGKRHGFDVGDIHGTATGNLFFLVHGNGAIFPAASSSVQLSVFLYCNGDQIGLGLVEEANIQSVDSPVDAELEKRRSSLAGDTWKWPVNRGVFVWQHLPLQSFHGFHVGGRNCGVTLRILFWLSE